ncbi:MAG TPA: class I SAM-dependent rRNA methyltransferase [Rhizomicrobium sp.]|jgi:23S rRNA (cytosine1962-C5)-methyltransferase
MNRPLIRVKPRSARRARAGAPWIFSNEILLDAELRALPAGSLVRVEGDDGRKFGAGYFNLNSLIAVRLLEAPAEAAIDRTFLAGRIARARQLRERFFEQPFYRLVNAEGDGLPGLTIDRFGDVAVVQISTAGMERLLDDIVGALDEAIGPACIVLRADSPSRSLEGLTNYVTTAKGTMPGRVRLEENGAVYFADLAEGQKSGWYYDQRENRAFAARLAPGRSVLDAYCYSGGFAIAAARAGARDVTGLDSSAPAIGLAEEAAAANGQGGVCRFVKADVVPEFERLASLDETFELVLCDPPPFVRARKDLEAGAHAYRKLARLAARVTARTGFMMLSSCSHNISPERFEAECAAGIARAGRRAALVRVAGAGFDHPVHPMLAESAYLKALVYALD